VPPPIEFSVAAVAGQHEHLPSGSSPIRLVKRLRQVVSSIRVERAEQLGKYETVTAGPNSTRPGVGLIKSRM
jgi:hypothetical protein